ncbi:unnamed protein product [Plutella xylostella]|uniref:(diamondback moth) hypothetical protein n=1 Tax=Plutella xylostella TaxID=51655 RepID=A0A8S4FN06_PLUXY|nr:unnamed protein product [Plutella xylostella]
MNQIDQNINKDMIDCELIDVDSLDLSDDQTWLFIVPKDSGDKVDIIDWNLSCDWPVDDNDYLKEESELYSLLDNILQNDVAAPDKQKFDSRTFVRPKKRFTRPSLHTMVDNLHSTKLASIPQNESVNTNSNKYLTYNKYNSPSPMLRLKTFNVDVNTDNSAGVKDLLKRRSLVQEDERQLEDEDVTLVSDTSSTGRLSGEHSLSRPIDIDLSQPAHNLHNTFNKGLHPTLTSLGSSGMYCSGESLLRMSPPSLVSSLQMDTAELGGRERPANGRPPAQPSSGRESLDHNMMTSMTLSILDEKDMSTSFLSQTTYPDNDSLMDSLPPSLVSSVNSSYIVPNAKSRTDSQMETNIFSSATFTHLEQSEKLLSARPRCQMFNSLKRDSNVRNSESYTKSREEACQIDILGKEKDNKKAEQEMAETITLHYNNKYDNGKEAEKENLNSTFEKDDAFYRDMGMQKTVELGKGSLNVTLNKQELNEIIQARQKLSLARKALPTDEKPLPNQVDTSPTKVIQLPNQTITVPRHSIENASELLSRRRALNSNGFDKQEDVAPTVQRETPKRTATFKKVSPKASSMDTTMVFTKPEENQIIDINSATLNLIDCERTLQQEEWNAQERAMVGSNESTDTGTFSSSSPPERGNDPSAVVSARTQQIASTPLTAIRKGSKNPREDLLNLQNTISPIYDFLEDKTAKPSEFEPNATINSATMVKKSSAKRDILAGKASPEKKMVQPNVYGNANTGMRTIPGVSGSCGSMAPPTAMPRKTGLPTSKLRQYSSHRELNRIPAASAIPPRMSGGAKSGMARRAVYSSNPALSPPPGGSDSYIVHQIQDKMEQANPAPAPPPPALVRQGTETLRPRPQSQLVAPKDHRAPPSPAHHAIPTRSHNYLPVPTARPYSISGASQLKVSRPSTVPTIQRPTVTQPAAECRPSSASEGRGSALPRPTRLPAPRRALRPPSVYSVAPSGEYDHY